MRGGSRSRAAVWSAAAAIALFAAAWSSSAWASNTPQAIVPMGTIPPANFSMTAEPSYTNGTSNTVSWSAGDDPGGSTPIEYYAEVSRLLGFGTVDANSGWILSISYTFSGLEDGILYYYHVRARDSVGNVAGFSAAASSTQDASPPPTPIIGVEPAFTVGTSNTVAWAASVDAGVGGVQYFAEASSSSTFATIAASSGWIAGNSTTLSGLSSGTTYYFHVTARDGFNRVSAWSSVEFSTQDAAAPTVPVINAEPAYTAGISNTISWSASTDSGIGGVEYQPQFSASATFASGVVTGAWQSATSYTASPLAGATPYYYRVSARDAFGQQSVTSAIVFSEQDRTAPTTPVFTAEPTFTNGTTNTVSWGASTETGSGGVQYYVEQSRSSTFVILEDISDWISGTSFTFTKLDDATTYFYRVKARDAVLLESAFSATAWSTQDASPPTVPLVASEPTFTAGTSNTISWAASTDAGIGAIQYFTEMSTSSTFSPITATFGWSGFTLATFSSLADGTTYFFHVKARDGLARESTFSQTVSSTQDNSPPTMPVVGAEPAFTAGLSNSITWPASTDAGSGAVTYFAQYSTSSTFAFGVVTLGPQSALTITASPLSDNTAYFYRVIAVDALGFFSAWSAAVTSTQDNSAPTVPAISAEPLFTTGSTNTVAWGVSVDAASGGVEYWVEVSRTAAFTIVEDASGWITGRSFTFSRLDDGVTFFYRVKARDAVLIESAFSSSTSSTQDATPPPVPTMNPMAAISAGTFQVPFWGAVTDSGSGGVQYFAEYSSSATFATVLGSSGWTSSTFWVVSSLSDGVTYYYHVKARDALLRESVFSSAVSSRQDNAAPTQPAMVAEPAFTAGSSNTVSWGASTDAGIGGVVYDAQIATNAAFTGATTQAGLSATSFTFSGLSDGTLYFYRVRARDGFGFATSFSASTSSRQDGVGPTAPQMNAEPAYSAGTSNMVGWTTSADAGVGGVQYDVQMSSSALFASLEAESGWISATSYTFTRLDDGQTYYFRVVARDAFGFLSNVSSTVSSTQDNSAPTTPILAPEPAFTQGTSNSISWGVSADAGVAGVDYQYRFSTSPTFSSGITTSAFQTATSATVSGLSGGTAYYFQVRARDAFGFATAWSNVEGSTQDASPPTVPTVTGEPSFTAGSSNTIAWSLSTDAGVGGVQYWAEYASTATFTSIIGNSGWISGTTASFVGLADGTRYYYRVKARDALLQESAFSASTNSQQDASPPGLPGTSAMASFTAGAAVTFGWSAASDAGSGGVQYEVQYAASAGFSTVLGSSDWIDGLSFTFGGLSDGSTYFFRVRARDSLGFVGNFSTVRSTTMDASAPTVPILVPLSAFSPGSSKTVAWAASSDAGVGGIQYQFQYSSTPAFLPGSTVTSAFGTTSPYAASGLSDGVTYFYRVRARDSFLFLSAWSAPERSTQDASPPSTPVPQPLDFYIDGPNTLLSWGVSLDSGVGGVEYQAEVSDDPFFFNIVDRSPWTMGLSYLFTGLSDATFYYYHVRARDAFAFQSAWSFPEVAMNDFRAPPVPAMNPLAAFSKGLTATVSWRNVFDAGVGGEEYQVLAFTSTDTSAPFTSTPWIGGTSSVVGGLPEGSRVYFAVHSRDLLGHVSALSALVWTVPDNSAPPVPGLTALPPFTSGLNLSVSWSSVTDAGIGGVLYRAQISSDPSFSVGVVDSGWLSTNTYLRSGLLDGLTYFARVKAQDGFSFESSWSAVERTQMDNAAPPSPSMAALPAFTEGTSVTVAWTGSLDGGVGGIEYLAQASLASDFALIARESGWQSAAAWTASGLADATRYYFRVWARDAFLHVSPASGSVSTTFDASPPSTPELLVMSAFAAGLQQTVRWSPSVDLGAGGVEYSVESAVNATFAQGAVTSGWMTAAQYTFAGLADGTKYYFRVHARDTFGYISNWSTVRNATVDNSAPTIAADQTKVTTNTADVVLTGTADDAVSGLLGIVYSTNGGANWTTASGRTSWQAVVSGLVEGETTVLVKAQDLVGFESPVARVLVVVDETAPLVAFQSPTNGTVLTGLVGVYAVIADSNFASFRLQQRVVGRFNFTDIIANGTLTRGDNFLGLWDTRALPNGLYELRLTAADTLDQVTTRTIQVRLLNSDLAVSYSDLQVSERAPLTGDRLNLTAVVTNFGTATAENVTVRITDNGDLIFERGGISIGPHDSFTTDVEYVVNRSGAHSFELEWSYPEGALDAGSVTSTVIEAEDPPVPEPKPFLVEYAGTFGPILLIALAALAIVAGWAIVQIARLRRGGGGVATGFGAEAVEVEWESDEMF